MDDLIKRWISACAVLTITACILLALGGLALYLYAAPALGG